MILNWQDLRMSSTSLAYLSGHNDGICRPGCPMWSKGEILFFCSNMLFTPAVTRTHFSPIQSRFIVFQTPLSVCLFFCWFAHLQGLKEYLDMKFGKFRVRWGNTSLYGTPVCHRELCTHTRAHKHTHICIFLGGNQRNLSRTEGEETNTPHSSSLKQEMWSCEVGTLHAVSLCHPGSFIQQFILSLTIINSATRIIAFPFQKTSKNSFIVSFIDLQ